MLFMDYPTTLGVSRIKDGKIVSFSKPRFASNAIIEKSLEDVIFTCQNFVKLKC